MSFCKKSLQHYLLFSINTRNVKDITPGLVSAQASCLPYPLLFILLQVLTLYTKWDISEHIASFCYT